MNGGNDCSQIQRGINCICLRTFNGEHLTLLGASPAIGSPPPDGQHLAHSPNPKHPVGHVVGAGKTTRCRRCDGIAATWFGAQTALCRPEPHARPIFIRIANALSGATVLVASKDDFEKAETQNPDEPHCHRQLGSSSLLIPVLRNSHFQGDAGGVFSKASLRELSLALRNSAVRRTRGIVKELERAKKKLETKLKELAGGERKDDVLTLKNRR